ncbi:chaperone-binding protein [Prunus dulcis]|uniref:Chaperone-binding protein n=1 Tax=Prunus dulcis TaxID=3755 RepID=A0A4Y1QK91_PRUDU|nr:chaperone-binding protein [Prunus dulcis]
MTGEGLCIRYGFFSLEVRCCRLGKKWMSRMKTVVRDLEKLDESSKLTSGWCLVSKPSPLLALDDARTSISLSRFFMLWITARLDLVRTNLHIMDQFQNVFSPSSETKNAGNGVVSFVVYYRRSGGRRGAEEELQWIVQRWAGAKDDFVIEEDEDEDTCCYEENEIMDLEPTTKEPHMVVLLHDQMEVRLSEEKDILRQDKLRVSKDLKLFLQPVREKLLQFEQELKDI